MEVEGWKRWIYGIVKAGRQAAAGVGIGSDMGKSYRLRQTEWTGIPRHYHGDSLKPFRLREGYLISQKEERLPILQNIRMGKAVFKLPKDLRTAPDALVRDRYGLSIDYLVKKKNFYVVA